jgi:hypothetical protein
MAKNSRHLSGMFLSLMIFSLIYTLAEPTVAQSSSCLKILDEQSPANYGFEHPKSFTASLEEFGTNLSPARSQLLKQYKNVLKQYYDAGYVTNLQETLESLVQVRSRVSGVTFTAIKMGDNDLFIKDSLVLADYGYMTQQHGNFFDGPNGLLLMIKGDSSGGGRTAHSERRQTSGLDFSTLLTKAGPNQGAFLNKFKSEIKSLYQEGKILDLNDLLDTDKAITARSEKTNDTVYLISKAGDWRLGYFLTESPDRFVRRSWNDRLPWHHAEVLKQVNIIEDLDVSKQGAFFVLGNGKRIDLSPNPRKAGFFK